MNTESSSQMSPDGGGDFARGLASSSLGSARLLIRIGNVVEFDSVKTQTVRPRSGDICGKLAEYFRKDYCARNKKSNYIGEVQEVKLSFTAKANEKNPKEGDGKLDLFKL